MGRCPPPSCRRGSNASLHDDPDHGVFGGSLRGLGHIGGACNGLVYTTIPSVYYYISVAK